MTTMGAKIQAFDIFQTPLGSHYPLPLNAPIVSENKISGSLTIVCASSFRHSLWETAPYGGGWRRFSPITFPTVLARIGLWLLTTQYEYLTIYLKQFLANFHGLGITVLKHSIALKVKIFLVQLKFCLFRTRS